MLPLASIHFESAAYAEGISAIVLLTAIAVVLRTVWLLGSWLRHKTNTR